MLDEASDSSVSYKDEDLALIKLSFEEFVKQNYVSCLKNLTKLEASIGSSPKISHNKAVVEYYLSDLQKHEQFRKNLQQLTGYTEFPAEFEIRDVKMCASFYNQALLLHHFREPQQALKIMTAVMNVLNHANHLDDNFIQRAYLLTLTILLDTNQPQKAKALLEQLENRLGITREVIINEDDEIAAANEEISLTLKEKDKNFEDFREMLKLCTIRVNLANGKSALFASDDTSEFSIVKGHQYYLGNDFQMAARELAKKFTNEPFTLAINGEDQDTIIANNMGLIHFAVRHYAMAVRFFQHALNFDKNANDQMTQKFLKDLPLYSVGSCKQTLILYNLGVALLYQQRPKEAFECLVVPLNYHHNNPRLWLRVAEACIMLHRQDMKQNESNKNLISSVVGSGTHRKYILQPTAPKHISDSCLFAIPSPNLEFAVLCLRNAYTLVEHFVVKKRMEEQKLLNADSNVEWDKKTEGIAAHPSKPLKDAAFEQLKSSILAAFSYVLLILGDYTLSLKYGKELLKIPKLPDTLKMLGHLYCAESLIMLNKVAEAISYLDPKFLSELVGEDFETLASPGWSVNSLDAAQAIITYNLAVALVIKGDAPEVAKSVLMSCNHPIITKQVKMLKLYMELQAGNIDNCQKMVQMDTPQFF